GEGAPRRGGVLPGQPPAMADGLRRDAGSRRFASNAGLQALPDERARLDGRGAGVDHGPVLPLLRARLHRFEVPRAKPLRDAVIGGRLWVRVALCRSARTSAGGATRTRTG